MTRERLQVDDLRLIIDTWAALRLGITPDPSRLSSAAPAVGGWLSTGDGAWRPLPQLRETIRRWRPALPRPVPAVSSPAESPIESPIDSLFEDDALRWGPYTEQSRVDWVRDGGWLQVLGRHFLCRPEVYGQVDWPPAVRDEFQNWAQRGDAASPARSVDPVEDRLLADLAGTLAPRPGTVDGHYPYHPIRPLSGPDYSARLRARLAGPADGQVDGQVAGQVDGPPPRGLGPVADRATALVFDGPSRTAFLRVVDRHRQAYGTLAPKRSQDILRQRLLGTSKPGQAYDRRIRSAEFVYRALRLATYWRLEQYLGVRFAGWRKSLSVDVPLGTESRFIPVQAMGGGSNRPAGVPIAALLAQWPVAARWVGVWASWVEQFDPAFEISPIYADVPRAVSLAEGLADDERADRELAALAELAFDDVNPRLPGPDPGAPWPQAQRMFLRALDLLLLLDSQVSGLRSRTPAAPMRAALAKRVQREPELGRSTNDRGGERGAGGDRMGSAGITSLSELDTVLDRMAGSGGAQRLRVDPEILHAWTSQLRADGSGRREARTLALTGAIGRSLRADPVRDPDRLTSIIDSAQMLSFDVTNLAATRTSELFQPILNAVPETLNAPLVANIWRALAIEHSKAHQYGRAQAMLHRATAVLDRLGAKARATGTDRTEINLVEASQQVYLQSTGLHARIVEMLLSDPRKRALSAQMAHEDEMKTLRVMATHAMEAGAHAYHLLGWVRKDFGLPAVKVRTRAATVNWEINTRCMHMRTLLLLGMLHAAEGELGTIDRATAGRLMRGLVDAVPAVYREATRLRVPPNLVPELTRIAMHYALLTGMRFLPPHPGANLPAHLTKAMALREEPGYPVFDLVLATDYLTSVNNDAGILSNINYRPVYQALDRYSRPGDGRLDVHYDRWVKEIAPHRARRPFEENQFMRGRELIAPPPIVGLHR